MTRRIQMDGEGNIVSHGDVDQMAAETVTHNDGTAAATKYALDAAQAEVNRFRAMTPGERQAPEFQAEYEAAVSQVSELSGSTFTNVNAENAERRTAIVHRTQTPEAAEERFNELASQYNALGERHAMLAAAGRDIPRHESERLVHLLTDLEIARGQAGGDVSEMLENVAVRDGTRWYT